MRITSRRTDVGYLRPLYVATNLIGEAPLCDFRYEKLIGSKIYVVYLVVLVWAIIVGNYYCLKETYHHALVRMNFPQRLTAGASTLLIGVHPIISIYSSQRYKKEILHLLSTVNRINAYSGSRVKIQACNKLFYLELLISNLIMVYVCVGMVSVRLAAGRIPDYEKFMAVAKYLIFLRNMLIYNIVKSMESCFGNYNEYMANFREVNFMVIYDEGRRLSAPKVVDNMHRAVRETRKIYEAVCGSIEAFNKAFGMDVLLCFVEFLVNLVAFINILLFPWRSNSAYDGIISSVRITYGTFIFLQLMAIIRTCDGAGGNAKKTALISTGLMQDDVLEPIHQDLLQLRDRADSCPPFGVLGLFLLNSRNLLASFGLLVSYLIITLGGSSH